MSTPLDSAMDSATLLRRRAAELARPHQEELSEQEADLLVLTVGGRRLAVPLEGVAEVRPPSPVAHVPGTSSVLLGLVGDRGDALAVASVSALLGLPTSLPPHEQWVAVLHDPTAPLGLLADGIEEIVRLDQRELTPATEAGGLVIAIAPDGTLLLDPVALLKDPQVSLHPRDDAQEIPWRER